MKPKQPDRCIFFLLSFLFFATLPFLALLVCASAEVPEFNDSSPEQTSEEIFSDGSLESESSLTETASGEKFSIIFKNGIHYIQTSEGEEITLFCMNNQRHWPHHTEDMGDTQVPDYTEGYLTPNDFSSPSEYEECMNRLSRLLYAGYPYNGERLYKIVDSLELHTPSEEQFNEMLIPPPVLQTAFPYLGHHAFTYQDWVLPDQEHLNELKTFYTDVGKLYPDKRTENGLSFTDISSMPFYRATFCMLNASAQTPLEVFSLLYSSSYFVTEEQAYNSTQNAVWRLLTYYNIPDNNITSLEHDQLAQTLYNHAERDGILDHKPTPNDIHLSGNLKFTYNPKDGNWHSGILHITEPPEYHGLYHLNLPAGMSALCDNLSYVYGNEEYELVSDHPPTDGDSFKIVADFIWLKELKQYAPSSDLEVNGKKFQNMVGTVIRKEVLSATVPISTEETGGISVTKIVQNEENCQKAFDFELRLPTHPEINGLYGDMEFHNGIANFSLKDGETITAKNLPAKASYEINETKAPNYRTHIKNASGEISESTIQAVTVTNTHCPSLCLGKTVAGETGDKTKSFSFLIRLLDESGNPVTETFSYIGEVTEELDSQIPAPESGTLTFVKGEATINLTHGQKIRILSLPPGASYTITELEAGQDNYQTTYDGSPEPATGTLHTDQTVNVVNTREFVPDTGITDCGGPGMRIFLTISISVLLLFFLTKHFLRHRG